MTLQIEPTRDIPPPYSEDDEIAPTLLEALAVAGNTAELQVALGAPLELDPSGNSARSLKAVLETRDRAPLGDRGTAVAAAAFLREYGQSLALDIAATRMAITTKLMELANCGDPRYELKALELLGKHSDIGLFTERSEITINYKSPADLENAITERVKRLLNADIIDVTPIGINLDDELGVAPDEEDAAEEAYAPDFTGPNKDEEEDDPDNFNE